MDGSPPIKESTHSPSKQSKVSAFARLFGRFLSRKDVTPKKSFDIPSEEESEFRESRQANASKASTLKSSGSDSCLDVATDTVTCSAANSQSSECRSHVDTRPSAFRNELAAKLTARPCPGPFVRKAEHPTSTVTPNSSHGSPSRTATEPSVHSNPVVGSDELSRSFSSDLDDSPLAVPVNSMALVAYHRLNVGRSRNQRAPTALTVVKSPDHQNMESLDLYSGNVFKPSLCAPSASVVSSREEKRVLSKSPTPPRIPAITLTTGPVSPLNTDDVTSTNPSIVNINSRAALLRDHSVSADVSLTSTESPPTAQKRPFSVYKFSSVVSSPKASTLVDNQLATSVSGEHLTNYHTDHPQSPSLCTKPKMEVSVPHKVVSSTKRVQVFPNSQSNASGCNETQIPLVLESPKTKLRPAMRRKQPLEEVPTNDGEIASVADRASVFGAALHPPKSISSNSNAKNITVPVETSDPPTANRRSKVFDLVKNFEQSV